jgi:hypothetical protein
MATMLQKSLKFVMCTGVAIALFAGSWLVNASSAAIITLSQPVLLSSLVNNPQAEIIAGDKKFTGFGYAATNDMPGAGGVNVIPILDDLGDADPNTGNYGVRFQGAFMDLVSSQGGSDALITYMVEVTDPLQLISTAHLAGNPNLLGQFGSISVTETFLPLGQNGEYTMEIYDDENFPTPKLTDTTTFLPAVSKLNVQKDILARAVAETAPNGNTATISFVDQTYGQIPVPEAATVTLALIGLVSSLGYRRRS